MRYARCGGSGRAGRSVCTALRMADRQQLQEWHGAHVLATLGAGAFPLSEQHCCILRLTADEHLSLCTPCPFTHPWPPRQHPATQHSPAPPSTPAGAPLPLGTAPSPPSLPSPTGTGCSSSHQSPGAQHRRRRHAAPRTAAWPALRGQRPVSDNHGGRPPPTGQVCLTQVPPERWTPWAPII